MIRRLFLDTQKGSELQRYPNRFTVRTEELLRLVLDT